MKFLRGLKIKIIIFFACKQPIHYWQIKIFDKRSGED
uniref:Uncharacterized protein n=1 Tax=Anguilla anguilla TaxID=7936 RepID=A0A0E9SUY4_ANGAN